MKSVILLFAVIAIIVAVIIPAINGESSSNPSANAGIMESLKQLSAKAEELIKKLLAKKAK
uniref:U20-myrmicitoxin-Mri1a n=1 Tax=Manica rubida TaxID=219785 RepID=TX20A_MANRB|nr:RecName: Full=U20-myrmicitoxin-Mri1a; Short=U20-MYRTX-Mri1a; Flags: Precursor [Manica rubida]QIQ51453.1 U20-MYRTX-Mri1a precursor [Manica rubida]